MARAMKNIFSKIKLIEELFCNFFFLKGAFCLPSFPWARIGASIYCKCSHFTEHLHWVPASFYSRKRVAALILRRFSHQFSCGNMGLCLFYWSVFVLMFPFKVRKTNPNGRAEKELAWIIVCAFVWLHLAFCCFYSFMLNSCDDVLMLSILYFAFAKVIMFTAQVGGGRGIGSKVLPCLPCRNEDEALKKLVLHYEW